MASLMELRTAVKTALQAQIPGLICYDTVPDVAQCPAVVVMPVDADFAVSLQRGTDTWNFDLFVLVPRTDSGLSQDRLDNYLSGSGPSSVRQAIYENRSLGLPDTESLIKSMRGYGGEFATARIPHVGAVLRLVVHTSGTA
ncbi:hypothetical protein ACMA1D_10695 [Streptomyces sp. 796.1]|uniref:hypothetical protein n=1 Tax=Streptomyces sp. 796.1 TaxID=3163029 RepID=UPI0039C927FC